MNRDGVALALTSAAAVPPCGPSSTAWSLRLTTATPLRNALVHGSDARNDELNVFVDEFYDLDEGADLPQISMAPAPHANDQPSVSRAFRLCRQSVALQKL